MELGSLTVAAVAVVVAVVLVEPAVTSPNRPAVAVAADADLDEPVNAWS